MPPKPGWSRDGGDAQPRQAKRQSIAERLRGTLALGGAARKEPPAAVQRRASEAPRQSPVPRIRQWLETCGSEHGHHCGDGDGAAHNAWRPRHLVDAVERRLVRAKPADRYAALSYVWGVSPRRAAAGPEPTLQLLAANVDALQLGLPDAGIPRTLLDAIWLSRKLAIRYLWVDRLCIVQDDDEDRAYHVQRMAHVFANACLTIVAAHGHVNTGLLPLDPHRPARAARPGAAPPSADHDHLLHAARWKSRCWTLQEHLYSRRAVFFFEDAVTWECHCDLWQGDVTPARGKRRECAGRVSSAALGFRHLPWPDMDEFARIAMDYSCRRLSLVDDTLPAFAGIAHVLSRLFSAGFAYGMPLMFLDIALLWRPQATIRRRGLSHPPFVPSWSWMGWWFDGIPVDLVLWRAAADYVEETTPMKRGLESKRFQASHSFRIKPTVAWSLTDRANMMTVASTGLQHRDLRSRKNSGAPLPRGWSRTGAHFKHDSDELTLFKYPVPVVDAPEEGDDERQQSNGPPMLGPLLSFKTTSGFFDIDYAISMVPRDRPNPPVAVGNIWSRSGRWIGEFRAHDGWLGVQSSNYDGDERLEFIAISTATERRGSYVFSAERFEENVDEDAMVDIVNVLWIERIGEVAYRRGLGHILQSAWDAQAKDEIDILLG